MKPSRSTFLILNFCLHCVPITKFRVGLGFFFY